MWGKELRLLLEVLKGQERLMAGITEIKAGQAVEKADLVQLTGLITQLLTAFAGGQMTPTQAQDLLDEITSQDATIKSAITSITTALPQPPEPQQG
jgi:hypothetical protein